MTYIKVKNSIINITDIEFIAQKDKNVCFYRTFDDYGIDKPVFIIKDADIDSVNYLQSN